SVGPKVFGGDAHWSTARHQAIVYSTNCPDSDSVRNRSFISSGVYSPMLWRAFPHRVSRVTGQIPVVWAARFPPDQPAPNGYEVGAKQVSIQPPEKHKIFDSRSS